MEQLEEPAIFKEPESDLVVGNIVHRYRHGLYSLVMVTGLPGTGKSSVCFRLSELAAAAFPGKKIIRKTIENLAQLARFAMDAKEDEVNLGVVEEVSTLFPSRRAMAGTSVDLAKVLDTCRKKKIILFANAPLWPSIDSHMRAMGTLYVETLKIYKRIGVVISKFFRLQTNPGSGKTYTHTMLRDGIEIQRMYTRMPNLQEWKEYEKKKDAFMERLYIKIQKREEHRDMKENKQLGIQDNVVHTKPLTERELRVYQMRCEGKTNREIGLAFGVTPQAISDTYARLSKKLKVASVANIDNVEKLKVSSNAKTIKLSNTNPEANKVTSEGMVEKNNNNEDNHG